MLFGRTCRSVHLPRRFGEELKAHDIWRGVSGRDIPANYLLVFLSLIMNTFLGITFTIDFSERAERTRANRANFHRLRQAFPDEVSTLLAQEPHNDRLIKLIDEKRIALMGSITLGLNDALVELSGAWQGSHSHYRIPGSSL